MDNATRLQYLEAMGIDVWVSRHPPVVDQSRPVIDDGLSENVVRVDVNPDAGVIVSGVQAVITEQTPQNKSVVGLDSALPALIAQSASPTQNDEQTWVELRKEVAACQACKLCETRTQTVFGVGSHHARWMLIGEAPGQNEDLQGEPFVGKAGHLLTEMLRAIGLKREEVFIANMLKCRPPNNRDPQAEEVFACHDFLLRQIELIQPRIIVAVGRVAAQNLLKTQQPLAKLRGVQHRLDNYPLVVVHHPAYLLRSLTEKAKAWDDLQFALSVYQSLEQE